MGWFKQLFRSNPDARELFQSTSRNLIQTILGIGVVWHFIATLGWPETFSPSLWLITSGLVVISILSLKLLQEYYLAAQLLWFGGLFGLILYAYMLYQRPEIIILLIFLPLIVIVTVGLTGASIVVGMIILLSIGMARLEVLPALPAGFGVALILGSIFSAFFGWGLASNLLDAIGSASYHYRQARKLLEETRQHRAQISRMLKDQHQANYQLERLNQMLFHARGRAETARHERDRFILAVSHELRSPLNFVIGFSDLMVNSPATYGPVEDWPPGLYADIQEVYRSSNHLLGLINDILDLGQIDAQEMALFPERVKFQTVVEDVVEMAARPFAQKGLWIKTEFEPDLPEVYVDCTRLRQVLLNLLNNSLRFTSQGGAWVRLQQVDQQLLVEVEDSGAGIEADDLPRVFDEFRQVGQDNWRRREGSGLGLSISRRFVRLHGGEMGVESEVGRGTRFYFTLPISGLGQLAPEPLQSLSSRRPYLQSQVTREKAVLVVYHDPALYEWVRQVFDDYQVIGLEDPASLPEMIRQVYPQVILLDEDHPQWEKVRGYEVPFDTPLLSVRAPGRQRGATDGALRLPGRVIDYLVKPVTREMIVATVDCLGAEVANILIVDDDPAMVRFVTQALRGGEERINVQTPAARERNFFTAGSSQEAIAQLRAAPVDAILLDLDLPDYNGWQLLAQIRSLEGYADAPVVILSAADPPEALPAGQEKMLELRMNRVLTKKELSAVLRSLVEHLTLRQVT